MRRESIPYQMGPPRPLVRRSRRKARALVYIVALTKKELRSTTKNYYYSRVLLYYL
jgi:hypothetical protein